ncbi:MAG TPA: PEGA domain-containing protein [Candidatus Sulfotelmatobacter sp.]|nr:PEGA domain-containing protein [Candidatus Sulfotelmatobacter sp.]
MKKQLTVSILIVGFLVTATALVIFFGSGYRIGFGGGGAILSGTGLLVTTSSPNGAQVFINGHLTTATDNTINLSPGEYDVKIFKDGYFPWEKKIEIKKEVVSKADALLFPNAPKLESITNIGISVPVEDPSKTKIAYLVASQSAVKNGIYVLDMTARPILTLQSASSQIANDTTGSFSNSIISWSPDSAELLAKISGPLFSTTYLLQSGNINDSPQDVTETISTVNASWQKLKAEKEKALMDSLSKKLKKTVAENFNILEWSADETKILYEASQSATLEPIIVPPLIGTDSTPEVRSIKKGQIYVYDIKEDRNYKILDSLPKKQEENSPLSIKWYPDSKHLVLVHDGKIDMMEYDAANQTTVYAGPFTDDYVFPWPDATKLVILTNLGNPAIAPNLYTVGLK